MVLKVLKASAETTFSTFGTIFPGVEENKNTDDTAPYEPKKPLSTDALNLDDCDF
jgi:hypothetical protein